MIAQMCCAKLTLRNANPRHGCLQRRWRDALLCEQAIKCGLLRDDSLTNRDRFGLHCLKQRLGPCSLVVREFERIG
jgi:hypothetical protein